SRARKSDRALPPRSVALDRGSAQPRGRVHPFDARTRPGLDPGKAAGGGSGMMGLSLSRILAILSKEFTQLVRDRLTYAMIIGIPVIQLLLFGYAINSDPKHLPAAVLIQDQGQFSRSILGALQRSDYFDLAYSARSPAEMNRL